MASPSFLRSRSFRFGLLATMLIVGMWARSVGHRTMLAWRTGETAMALSSAGGGVWFSSFGFPSAFPFEYPLLESTPLWERRIFAPALKAERTQHPVGQSFPHVIEISLAWWLVLAVNLILWAAVMAWRHRLRKHAEFPPPGPGEARE